MYFSKAPTTRLAPRTRSGLNDPAGLTTLLVILFVASLHDSPYVLDGLMENQTSLEPKQLMTDTAGYSDIVFALFWLLGFQFSPRLADIGESRFWRLDRAADYGALNGLASHRLNSKLITQNWDDFLRVAGSIKMGKVSAASQRGLIAESHPCTHLLDADIFKIAHKRYQIRRT
jgi:TnpA family transposase